jgi:hypothetical protein
MGFTRTFMNTSQSSDSKTSVPNAVTSVDTFADPTMMAVMSGNARVWVYRAWRSNVPTSIRRWIARIPFARTLRDLIVRRKGRPLLLVTDVRFERLRFWFAAPLKITAKIRSDGGIENKICRLVMRECGPGAVGIDVGANYGFVSMVMAAAAGSTGRVFAFEADPIVFTGLQRNVELNALQQRCQMMLTFVAAESQGGERTAIDDFIDAQRLDRMDFLKIDVDGPELQVLVGARRTLVRFRPVVVVEMTRDHQAIHDLLQSAGYTCCDMQGRPADPANWPPNLVAAAGRAINIPPQGSQR